MPNIAANRSPELELSNPESIFCLSSWSLTENKRRLKFSVRVISVAMMPQNWCSESHFLTSYTSARPVIGLIARKANFVNFLAPSFYGRSIWHRRVGL